MGLLDDLKQQADSVRQKELVTQQVLNQNLMLAHARLKDALRYWVQVFDLLNIVKPVIPRCYYLEGGATKFETGMQCDYNVNGRHVTVDHKDYIGAMVLRFRCVSDQKLVIEKQSDVMVKRLREQLLTSALKFDLKEVRSDRGYVERGIFTITPEVPVIITIAASLDTEQIKITAKNLEKFGEYVYIYDYDEFSTEILEELGKDIVAKPNTFRTLGRHQEAMRSTTIRAPGRKPDEIPSADSTAMAVAGVNSATKH